jgi:hypothetical protein
MLGFDCVRFRMHEALAASRGMSTLWLYSVLEIKTRAASGQCLDTKARSALRVRSCAGAVAPETCAEQPGWRGRGVSEGAETGLHSGFAGDARERITG